MATLSTGDSGRKSNGYSWRECVEPSPVPLWRRVTPLGARSRSRSRSPGPEDGEDEDEACQPGSSSAAVAAGTTQPSGGSAPLKRPHIERNGRNGSLGGILRRHYEERWRGGATTDQITQLLKDLFPEAIAAASFRGDLPTTITKSEFEEILFFATQAYVVSKEACADGADVDDALQKWATLNAIRHHKNRLWIYAFIEDAIEDVQ